MREEPGYVVQILIVDAVVDYEVGILCHRIGVAGCDVMMLCCCDYMSLELRVNRKSRGHTLLQTYVFS